MDTEKIKNQFTKYVNHILMPIFPSINHYTIDERHFSIINDKSYINFIFYCEDLNESLEMKIHEAIYDMLSYFGYQDSVIFGTEFKTI